MFQRRDRMKMFRRQLPWLICFLSIVLVCSPGIARSGGDKAGDIATGDEQSTVASMPVGNFTSKDIDADDYQQVRQERKQQREELKQQRQKERLRKKRQAEKPGIFLCDIINVMVEKNGNEVRVTIMTTDPVLFETTKGINGEGMNFITIDFPNVSLEWSEGEKRTISIEHGGIKEITLSEELTPQMKVQAEIQLLPKALYRIFASPDGQGLIIESKGPEPEPVEAPPQEITPEEKIPPVHININVVDADIQQVLKVVSEQSNMNIVTSADVKGQITVSLKDVTLDTAMEVILGINGLDYRTVDNTMIVAAKEDIAEKIRVSQVIKLQHIDAESAKEILSGITDKDAIQANKETNNIIVTDVPENIQKVKEVLAELDRPAPQVELAAKVIEVGVDFMRNFGLDWSNGIGIDLKESRRPSSFIEDAITAPGSPFQFYRLARTAFETKLNAIIDEGNAKILSNPRIVTMKDKEAMIFIGDRIPYTITTVAGGVATTEVRFIEPGIRLTIVPKLINDGSVVMDISPEVSYIYGFRGPSDEYPWVKTREAQASVRLKDGETLILGGLLSKEDKESISRVPFLSSVPVMGQAFKNDKITDYNTELLIVVTPTIMRERV